MSDKPGLAISRDQLYAIQPSGSIFAYIPYFNAWATLDAFSESSVIAAGNDHLYQMHTPDNSIWTFTAAAAPQWARIDGNRDTKIIAADGEHLYQVHQDGLVFEFDAKNKTWITVDRYASAAKIAADADALYQLSKGGAILQYDGPTAGVWTRLDDNPMTKDIVAGGGKLYQLHKNGLIWQYVGAGNWKMLDNNPSTLQIAAGKAGLFQRHKDKVWKYDGTTWIMILNAVVTSMVVGDVALYIRNDLGIVSRYKDGAWTTLTPVPNA